MTSKTDEYWMQFAIKLAEQAKASAEVPVGAIVVLNDKIIGEGFNQPITMIDPSAHAEIIALRGAAKKINNYRLLGATLYVTLEPCLMCTGAMIHSRINKLVYGAKDKKTGVIVSRMQALTDYIWNHKIECKAEILAKDCGELLTKFFQAKRKK